MPIQFLGELEISHLERGATLLGSGGGGQTDAAARMLRRSLPQQRIQLVGPDELGGRYVVPVGIVGAVSVFTEKLPSGGEWTAVMTAIIERTGIRPDGLVCMEAGGVNGIVVFVAAAELGLPVVDADLMGRALPRLDQLSMAALGESLTPVAIGDGGGRLLVVDGLSPAATERIVRSSLSEFGGWAAIALRPIPVAELERLAILGSLSRALHLGAQHADWTRTADTQQVATSLGARILVTGRVAEVVRHRTAAGFGRGSVIIRADQGGTLVRLEMENEYLLVLVDGRPVASTPDILCVIDHSTGVPLSCEAVRGGAEVVVLQIPGPPFWLRPEVIDAVAPRAFGLETEPLAPLADT
jgi:DUF917 family protein